jgi:hypothetical protein
MIDLVIDIGRAIRRRAVNDGWMAMRNLSELEPT